MSEQGLSQRPEVNAEDRQKAREAFAGRPTSLVVTREGQDALLLMFMEEQFRDERHIAALEAKLAELEGARERTIRECANVAAHYREISPELYEALEKFARWYDEDSTEYTRDMAYDAAIMALAKARAAPEAAPKGERVELCMVCGSTDRLCVHPPPPKG